MTQICVPIAVQTPDQALADARAARDAGADLVEFRVDGFFDASAARTARAIVDLVADSPLPSVVTCRVEGEGGEFTGSDADRGELYRALASAAHPPAYLDVELASLETSPELSAVARDLAARANDGAPASRLIVSMHDFTGRPTDLARRLARLRERDDASVIKIAYRARSLRDNLELFELLESRDRPTIALGMGEFGLLSRVLAPKFGGYLTFASLRDRSATAPGQPTIGDLTGLYRFHSIGAGTRVFGVIGWPVGHSLSPAVHNAAFAAAGFDGVYLPLPIPPEWEHFKATLGALTDDPRLDFNGASVTIPHKEHLVRLARERADEGWTIDETASATGAANTIVRVSAGWRVLNTDMEAIQLCLREAGLEFAGARVAILGAGGVARAAAAGALAEGAYVTIYNRTLERAETLARDLDRFAEAHGGSIVAVSLGEASGADSDAIINATSIGMVGGPAPNQSPIDLRSLDNASPKLIVLDTVYAPPDTPLLRQARSLGFTTIDGVSVFGRQAFGQFREFTQGPRDAIGVDYFERSARGLLDP